MSERNGKFPTTKWTLISRLRSRNEVHSRRALDDLCSQYHYPLYCYIRRRGLPHHDAQDALHDFFTKLLRLESLHDLHQEAGRLRGFLCKALDRSLRTRFRSRARDPLTPVPESPLPLGDTERRFAQEQLSDDDTPDRVFERKWAHELLSRVLFRLREKYAGRGKEPLFEALRPAILNGGTLRGEDHRRIATALGMTPGTLRVAMVRLLGDYRTIFRDEVRQTVERDDDIDDEIAHLMTIFQRS